LECAERGDDDALCPTNFKVTDLNSLRAFCCATKRPVLKPFKQPNAVRNPLREQMGPKVNTRLEQLIRLLTQAVLTSD